MTLIVILSLAGCAQLDPPIAKPELIGEWRCENDLQLVFQPGNKYVITNPTGTRFGTFEFKAGEKNLNDIKLTQDKSFGDEAHAFPPKFRYTARTTKTPRDTLYFYGGGWEPFQCEKLK